MAVGYITAFFVPLLLCLLFTPWAIRLAPHINAVDDPGGRKIHAETTPRIGGLAIVSSIILTLGILYFAFPDMFEGIRSNSGQAWIIGGCMLTIFLLGFCDDLSPLRPGIKFGVQIAVAAVIYYAGFQISNVTNPVGEGFINVDMLDFPLTLLWIVGITNAFNLIDGLDGLATGVATIASLSIFTVSLMAGQLWFAMLTLVMTGALIGFLRYNFNPAKIFLGDSGSLFIGFAMALLSIQSTTKISTGMALLFPMLVLGLPITDTLISMLRRFLGSFMPERSQENKKSILGKIHHMFNPDSSHIHHQLLNMGLTHRNTVLVLYFVSAFFAAGAFAITHVENTERSILIGLLLFFAIFLGIKKLRYREIEIFNNGMMLPFYEKWIINRKQFLSLIDLTFIAAAYSMSYNLIYNISPEAVSFLNFEQALMVILSTQLITFWLTGVYRERIKQMGIGNVIKITASVAYSVFATSVFLLVMTEFPMVAAIQFLVLDFYFLLTFTLGLRIAYHALNYWFNRNKRSGANVLIYGANENGTMILHRLNNSREDNYKVLGFLDDDTEMEGEMIYGYPVLGDHWQLARFLRNNNVDYIFFCENDVKPEDFNRLKNLANQHNIAIKRLQIRLKNILEQPADQKTISAALEEKKIKM